MQWQPCNADGAFSSSVTLDASLRALTDSLSRLDNAASQLNQSVISGSSSDIESATKVFDSASDSYSSKRNDTKRSVELYLSTEPPHSRKSHNYKIMLATGRNVDIGLAYVYLGITYYNLTRNKQMIPTAIGALKPAIANFESALQVVMKGDLLFSIPPRTTAYANPKDNAEYLVRQTINRTDSTTGKVAEIDVEIALDSLRTVLNEIVAKWINGIKAPKVAHYWLQKAINWLVGILKDLLDPILRAAVDLALSFLKPFLVDKTEGMLERFYDLASLKNKVRTSCNRFELEYDSQKPSQYIQQQLNAELSGASYKVGEMYNRFSECADKTRSTAKKAIDLWNDPWFQLLLSLVSFLLPFVHTEVFLLVLGIQAVCCIVVTLDGYDYINSGSEKKWYFYNRVEGYVEIATLEFEEAIAKMRFKPMRIELDKKVCLVGETLTATITFTVYDLCLYHIVRLNVTAPNGKLVYFWEGNSSKISFPYKVKFQLFTLGIHQVNATFYHNGVSFGGEDSTSVNVLPASTRVVSGRWMAQNASWSAGAEGTITFYDFPGSFSYSMNYSVITHIVVETVRMGTQESRLHLNGTRWSIETGGRSIALGYDVIDKVLERGSDLYIYGSWAMNENPSDSSTGLLSLRMFGSIEYFFLIEGVSIETTEIQPTPVAYIRAYFTMGASPDIFVIRSRAVASTITVTSIDNFSSPVSLSIIGLPTGVTASIKPTSVVPPVGGSVTSVLTLTVDNSTKPGSYSLAVNGTSGTLYHCCVVNLLVKASSSISTALSPSQVTYGSSAAITGSVDPAHSQATISLSLNEGTSWSVFATTITDSSGRFSISWRPPRALTYLIRASWGGDDDHMAATSSSATLTVNPPDKGTCRIMLDASPKPGHVNSPLTISGAVYGSWRCIWDGMVVGKPVEIATGWGFRTVLTTDYYGQFSVTTNCPSSGGTYSITATFYEDQDLAGNSTTIQYEVIAKIPTTITISYVSNREFGGYLKRADTGTYLAYKPVKLTVTYLSGTTWQTATFDLQTRQDGYWNLEFLFYWNRATITFEGDETYAPSSVTITR